MTREAKTGGECGRWERRRRRAGRAPPSGDAALALPPARLHRTRARRFLGPRRRRPRASVARLDRSLRTRVLTRPAGKTAHERGDTSNGTSPRRILLQTRRTIRRARTYYSRDTPRGRPEAHRNISNESTAASLGHPSHRRPIPLHAVLHTITSVPPSTRHPLAPPASAVHPRRPLALPTHAASQAPPACARHAVITGPAPF